MHLATVTSLQCHSQMALRSRRHVAVAGCKWALSGMRKNVTRLLIHDAGKISWTREESLASLLSVEMVDLPVSMIDAQMEDEFGGKDDIFTMFINRFSTQLSQLKEFFIQLKNKLRTPKHHYQVDYEFNFILFKFSFDQKVLLRDRKRRLFPTA